MVNGQPVGDPINKVGVVPCSNRVEPGLFFFPGNGSNLFKAGAYCAILNYQLVHITIYNCTLQILVDRFTVGRTVDIQMDIKPRSSSGHLLSVHGKRDYLVLEMVNGTVKFLVKTARGSIETSFVPTSTNSLCDGNWHNIRGNIPSTTVLDVTCIFQTERRRKYITFYHFIRTAVKQKNAVLLSVDHKAAAPGIGGKNVAGVLSKHPIFIGGHPMLGRRLRGSTLQAQYVGCIGNIHINMRPISIGPERAYGQVMVGVCPTI